MIKRCITILILCTAPLNAEPNQPDNTVNYEDIARDYLETLVPESMRNLALPNVPGEVKLKKLKELHWNSNETNLNFNTELDNLDSLGMNYATENTQSTFELDSSGEYQFRWQFKKTFGGPK